MASIKVVKTIVVVGRRYTAGQVFYIFATFSVFRTNSIQNFEDKAVWVTEVDCVCFYMIIAQALVSR